MKKNKINLMASRMHDNAAGTDALLEMVRLAAMCEEAELRPR